jgi:hypothetical protein
MIAGFLLYRPTPNTDNLFSEQINKCRNLWVSIIRTS